MSFPTQKPLGNILGSF